MMWLLFLVVLVALVVTDLVYILIWYVCCWPRSQILGPAVVRGPADGRRVALTFDDGPAPPFTEQILDILSTHQVQATFFLCGQNVERFPETVRRIQEEGHTIGNHTYSHPYLYFLSRARIADEIDRTQGAIRKITGLDPLLFRPPYGGRWFGLYPLLRQRGMRLVQWSDAADEPKNDAAAIVDATLQRLGSGSVICLHDGQQTCGFPLENLLRRVRGQTGLQLAQWPRQAHKVDRSNTVEALPTIIDRIRKAGFEFVSVKDFLPHDLSCGGVQQQISPLNLK